METDKTVCREGDVYREVQQHLLQDAASVETAKTVSIVGCVSCSIEYADIISTITLAISCVHIQGKS
jgi:hypothetical protein